MTHASTPPKSILRHRSDTRANRSTHPYLVETLHIQYPPRLFEPNDPNQPRSYEETPFTWIDSPDELSLLLGKLRSSNEIAVDLEYHSLRSYYGFVCLMQISTREEDFVIDTLALREELEALNEVFTDPSIVKVCTLIFPKSHSLLTGVSRSFMGRTEILSGFSKISIYTLSTCLTHIRRHCYWAVSQAVKSCCSSYIPLQVSPSIVLHLSLAIFVASMPTKDTNLPTGEYGKHICPRHP
jgi:hypothetical protein